MGELQDTVEYLRGGVAANRRLIFWFVVVGLLLVLLYAVKEVTVLLLAAYGIALLIDPIISSMERRGLSRSTSVILLFAVLVVAFVLLVVIAVPKLVREYQHLIQYLPGYLQTLGERTAELLKAWLGVNLSLDFGAYIAGLRERLSALGVEQVRPVVRGIGLTMLRGYSLVLTVINLCLLPFLVYYIARDLGMIHRFLGSFFAPDVRARIESVGTEILKHVHAFFKGQLTVSLVLAFLYFLGLWLVGLPSALLVGLLTGLLNVVPYLGIGLGLVLATIITGVTDPSVARFALVYAVFIVIQLVEGNVLTPRIVGRSVGLHPLGVMLALIVGGQLLGLLGLILAIPATAAVRVLFRNMHELFVNDNLVVVAEE